MDAIERDEMKRLHRLIYELASASHAAAAAGRLEEAEELLEKLFAPVTELRKLYESDLRKRDASRP